MPAFRTIFSSLATGNFRDAANAVFIDQKTVDTLEANKSQLENRVIKLEQQGTVSTEQRDKILNGIANTAFPQSHLLTGNEPLKIFASGVKSDVGSAINAVALSIPWQIWVIALLAGAVMLGPALLPIAARYFKK